MIRRPRATKPDTRMTTLGQALHPLTMYPWSNAALSYLGVPVTVGQIFIVVNDADIDQGVQKLEQAGFSLSKPDRELYPDVLKIIPNPEEYMANLHASWASLDNVSKVFDHPSWRAQIFVVPNSFARIPDTTTYPDMVSNQEFDSYDNVRFPLERALIESFTLCTLNDPNPAYNEWRAHLLDSISLMTRYLDIENDILDGCRDSKAIAWFSERFGREYEAKNGPRDLRISKRLGSGKELPVNSRGKLLSPEDLAKTNQSK